MNNTATLNMVNIYAGMIDASFTPAQKFDLVNKILSTLRPVKSALSVKASDADIFDGFSADFGGEGTAVEIANNIRYSHPTGSRNVEVW